MFGDIRWSSIVRGLSIDEGVCALTTNRITSNVDCVKKLFKVEVM